MLKQPLVSIIIPTYNRAHLIGETLDSVLAQTYKNWECIVVDDGSTDNTDEVMAAYCAKDSRFRYYHRPDSHKPGGNGARNYGFLMSKGEYVNWFDSDDLMLPKFVETKILFVSEEVDIIITTGYEWNVELDITEKITINTVQDLYTEYSIWSLKLLTPSVLFKRSFFDELELFNETILRGQETEFFSRVFFGINENRFILINQPLFLYRQHNQTKSGENRDYVSEFKLSIAFLAINNLKRSKSIKNKTVFYYSYRKLISLLSQAIRHRDEETRKFIIKKILPILKKKNTRLAYEIQLVSPILVRISKGRTFFQRRWSEAKVKI